MGLNGPGAKTNWFLRKTFCKIRRNSWSTFGKKTYIGMAKHHFRFIMFLFIPFKLRVGDGIVNVPSKFWGHTGAEWKWDWPWRKRCKWRTRLEFDSGVDECNVLSWVENFGFGEELTHMHCPCPQSLSGMATVYCCGSARCCLPCTADSNMPSLLVYVILL
jgi:hypothetical protein